MSLYDMFLAVDIFGEDIGFTVGDGNRQSRHPFRAILTLLVYATLLAYGVQKHNELQLYEETSFFTSESENPNIYDGVVFEDTGVKFMFGVHQIHKNQTSTRLDESYFEVLVNSLKL